MIYLDNAATSFPKAPGVAEALSRQISEIGGNPGRARHSMALAADRLLYDAREAVARLVGAEETERIVFAKNATEALNAVLLGSIGQGAVVATSSLEHNAVMRPLRWLEETRAARIIVVRCDECGRPDAADLAEAAACRPDLAVFTMASNVTGALLPWEAIAGLFEKSGSLVCLDGSQAIGHLPISVEASGVDFLCFPGHKGLLGPTGTGCLCIAGERVPEALIRGGTGSHSDSERQPDDLPDRFEAGTQNLPGAAGLLASASFLAATGLEAVRSRESALTERLLSGLRGITGLRVYGPPPGIARMPVVSVSAESTSLDELARELDLRGIAVRMGLQCAPAAHRSIGTLAGGGTLRFSPGFFTTEAEIDEALVAMEDIVARGELR